MGMVGTRFEDGGKPIGSGPSEKKNHHATEGVGTRFGGGGDPIWGWWQPDLGMVRIRFGDGEKLKYWCRAATRRSALSRKYWHHAATRRYAPSNSIDAAPLRGAPPSSSSIGVAAPNDNIECRAAARRSAFKLKYWGVAPLRGAPPKKTVAPRRRHQGKKNPNQATRRLQAARTTLVIIIIIIIIVLLLFLLLL